MPSRVSRRTLLRIGAFPVLGGGVAGSGVPTAVSSADDVRVNVRFPPGADDAAATAVDALQELDAALSAASGDDEGSLSLGTARIEHPVSLATPDDAVATVRQFEDAFYGVGEPSDASRTVELVCYRHGLPWQQFDELGGAGFAQWRVGVAGSTQGSCGGWIGPCERRYDDVAGEYALAFVNLGILSVPARTLLGSLGYDAHAMFANTVLHEVAHCFGAAHEHGTVGVGDGRAASPMLTWYCENALVANDRPGACCGGWDDAPTPDDHAAELSACARRRIGEHATEHLH